MPDILVSGHSVITLNIHNVLHLLIAVVFTQSIKMQHNSQQCVRQCL